ncbi:MAG: cell envelope integrity protein CreD [Chitinophagaceae bacterium]|nr:MAG: cell envelope integrity protein CreD [Chitinophagaceae bacterium]
MKKDRMNFWQENRLIVKAMFIGILTLLLLIPAVFILSLVNDRESRHDMAYKEISSKWAGTQTLTGPILVIPYQSSSQDARGNAVTEIRQGYFLPDSLQVNGVIKPEKRYRGIYEAILYRSDLQISGKFSSLNLSDLKIPVNKWLPEQSYLLLGVSDMRGIENQLAVEWNGIKKGFNPGTPQNALIRQGVYVPVSLNEAALNAGNFNFSLHLQLKGSGELDVAPLGKNTQVTLRSPWATPSFTGNFLPDYRKINKNGFDAHWTIFNLNRNLPQQWTEGNYDPGASKFGVSLMLPVDAYQKTMRCIKYAILIIALTFLVFFLIETSQNSPVHPFQYMLIGFALCIFYTLLLSLSEYIHFALAYGISTIASTGLISIYASSLFKKKNMSFLVAIALLALYGFIFTLVQLQDYSLLFGSVGLFIIVAMLMYCTRKINQDRQAEILT